MKRVTMWYDGNRAICENEECSSGNCPFADPICEQVQNIIDRLASIEDILGDEYDLDEISKIVRCKNCVYMVGRAEFPGEYYCKILADTVPFDGFCHRGKAALKAREQK